MPPQKEDKDMKTWWNDKNIEIVEIEGRWIALEGWNGESWTDCWEVEEIVGDTGFGIKDDNLEVAPIYNEEGDYAGFEFL